MTTIVALAPFPDLWSFGVKGLPLLSGKRKRALSALSTSVTKQTGDMVYSGARRRQGRLPEKVVTPPADEKRATTEPPAALSRGLRDSMPLLYVQLSRMMITLSANILFDKLREGKYGVLRVEDQNLPPKNTGLQRNTLEEFRRS